MAVGVLNAFWMVACASLRLDLCTSWRVVLKTSIVLGAFVTPGIFAPNVAPECRASGMTRVMCAGSAHFPEVFRIVLVPLVAFGISFASARPIALSATGRDSGIPVVIYCVM